MGAQTTGLNFLIQRPSSEGSLYVYYRRLAGELAPLVSGRIELPWTAAPRDLVGLITIKISLKTDELRLARDRWAIVHPQVEALVQVGMARLRHKRAAAFDKPVPVASLDKDSIRQLAAQAHHDILAADDATWEAGALSPLAAIIKGVSPSLIPHEHAEKAAHGVEYRHAKGLLSARDLAGFDQTVSEFEVDIETTALDELRQAASSRTSLKLSQTLTGALIQKRLPADEIPSDVEALLTENGIALPKGNPDRRALALSILRAKVDALRIVEERLGGAATATPERPPLLARRPDGPRISKMRERWIELYEPGPKAIDDNDLYVGRFIEMFGDLPVAAVTRQMIREFRDQLAICARNMPRSVRAMSFKAQIEWSATHGAVPKLSRQTVNRKGIGSMSACMRAAIKDEVISANPCSNQDLPQKKGQKVVRLPYSAEDLDKIFATAIYTMEQKRWVGGAGEAQFWMPLIALFSGARLEEIGQLLCADIKIEDGILFFDFVDLPDEDDPDAGAHEKKLKTANARRRVPVHPELLDLGFNDYVEKIRATGGKMLFPALKPYRARMTHNWSKWWARHTDIFVTTSPTKVFHSFRHKFIDRARNLTLDRTVLKAIVGHSSGDVTDLYGESVSLSTRYDFICKLTYPDLDLTHVKDNRSPH